MAAGPSVGQRGEEEVTEDWSEVGEERGDGEDDNIRSHVKVWAHGRKQKWEPQSSSLAVFDPTPIPDYDFKMEIWKRSLLLDDVPKGEGGKGLWLSHHLCGKRGRGWG